MSPRLIRLPWMRDIDPCPGMSRSSTCRPRMSTTFGWTRASCCLRYGEHASASLGIGSRFIGGRHLGAFLLYTWARAWPILASSVYSSFPSAPAIGSPLLDRERVQGMFDRNGVGGRGHQRLDHGQQPGGNTARRAVFALALALPKAAHRSPADVRAHQDDPEPADRHDR